MSHSDLQVALAASLAKANLDPGPASGLVPEDFVPTTSLRITFGAKAVQLGTFFRASECREAPAISFAAASEAENASHTLVLTDPDAPTPDDPRFAFWRHWILSGLKASGAAGVVDWTGKDVTAYLGPGPKDDSKPHRYLFLLYREPKNLVLTKNDLGGEEFTQRRSFKPSEFAEKHNLVLVGVNWMTCAGDGWVGEVKDPV
ncbi:phosphatidylethanolamine-binding protein [Xylariaceae sp. FL0016]|nr:phosphatidylethanolamine-binding protein [Xylariaceae sp. FL0016]